MNNQIKKYRKQAKLTQAGLAKLIGGSGQSIIANYENGTRKPDLQQCRAIVKAFNTKGLDVTLDDVFPASNDSVKISSII